MTEKKDYETMISQLSGEATATLEAIKRIMEEMISLDDPARSIELDGELTRQIGIFIQQSALGDETARGLLYFVSEKIKPKQSQDS
jgi:hypothetical protein